MAKSKTAFRKRFNVRWVRWTVMRALCAAVPALKTRLSFSTASAPVSTCASRVIINQQREITADFTPEQIAMIVKPAVSNERGREGKELEKMLFLKQIAFLNGTAILGHAETLVRSCDNAMIRSTSGWTPNWNFAKPAILQQRVADRGKSVSLVGTRHYYHFFANRIVPFLDYLFDYHTEGEPLHVWVGEKTTEFQTATYEAMSARWPELVFETIRKHERVEIDELLWIHSMGENAEWMPVTPQRAQQLAGLMRAHYRLPAPTGGKRLFLSRGNVKLRRLLNEEEFLAVAARYGFEPFVATPANHAEQVRRFGEADVVVAVHGAGLTNLLFARPGTVVIEIFPENFIKSTFLWLATRLGMEYHAIVGGRGDYDQAFSADAAQFDHLLASILERDNARIGVCL